MSAVLRRLALCVVAAIGLLALAAAAPAGSGPAAPAPAVAQDCVWKKHTKKVVRWVRRDGRKRRVVRRRVWWRCHPVAVAPTPPIPPLPVDPVDPDPLPGFPARLGVRASEFSYVLSRPTVVSGDVIIELNNRGEDPHNLQLAKAGTGDAPMGIDEIGPLTHASGKFSLSPGTYRLWCSLPMHDEWGMSADLVVTR